MKNVVLQKYEQRAEQAGSLLCVGLDPEFDRIPKRFLRFKLPLFEFSKWVIEQTAEFAAAYKPNTAFFEARGSLGWARAGGHRRTAAHRVPGTPPPSAMPSAPTLRTPTAATSRASSIISALMRSRSRPYLGKDRSGAFPWSGATRCASSCARTSNPGAGGFQDLHVDGCPLWQVVAEQVCRHWNHNHNCMLVTGATLAARDALHPLYRAGPHLPGAGHRRAGWRCRTTGPCRAGLARQGAHLQRVALHPL